MTFPTAINLQKSIQQDALLIQKVIQQIRPELIKAASANTPKTSATRWVDIEAKKIAINQNPAIVFDSLLHKSASVTNKESHESFEDAIL
jgi:hypothetical protein